MSKIIPMEYLVTFAETNVSDFIWDSTKSSPNYEEGNKGSYTQNYDQSSQICLSEGIDTGDMLPAYPYNFNPGIYQTSSLSIPRNVFQTISEKDEKNRRRSDTSILYHMPHWKYYSFTSDEQEQFISKYFPERLALYRQYKYDEERSNLFVYLWLYINGGLYISSEYEILKPLDIILDVSMPADLYFMFDHDRYISPRIFASQPFCGFWMEVVNLMEKRKSHHYPQIKDQIDRNTGRALLTDMAEETEYKYEILPRNVLDPYSPCDSVYDKDSYLKPVSRNFGFLSYMKCQTGSSDELLYITGAIIFLIAIMILIALITQ